MKRAIVLLLLLVVFLTVTTSVVMAKEGQAMELVCWVDRQGNVREAYYWTTGSGIVHRVEVGGDRDGQHDRYKPESKFDMPGEGGWELWTPKEMGDCAPPSDPGFHDFLPMGATFWHKYN